MLHKNKRISLEGKMGDWGPFGKNEGKWLIFSIRNHEEGLGGFLIAGGEYTKALGTKYNDKFGLWNCLKRLRTLNNGKVRVIKELGL